MNEVPNDPEDLGDVEEDTAMAIDKGRLRNESRCSNTTR